MMLHANQLQFNLDTPADLQNLKTNFASPSVIQYEAVMSQSPIKKEKAPFEFKSVSSKKLSNAVLLAKRDLKLARRKKVLAEFAADNELSYVTDDRGRNAATGPDDASGMGQQKIAVFAGNKNLGIKLKKHSSTKSQAIGGRAMKNDGPPMTSKQQQEILDIRRLRLEIQQVLLNLQKTQDAKRIHLQSDLLKMDVEEEQKLLVRHLEQMRKHSRTIYTLQQQVQVIKQDLKKSTVGDDSSNQTRLLGKVAAAHRGTSRLLHVYCPQLPEYLVFPDNFVAVNALFQEVSKLLRELALCALQLNLADVEDVERLADAVKSVEPKCGAPPKPVVAGRTPKSPRRRDNIPQRSFRSKDVSVIKKSYTKPKLPRPSFSTPKASQYCEDMAQSFQAVDLIDRPEWRPPSNSPYKSVGPAALGPLLESPSSKHVTKPKTVKFFHMSREHDIDTYENKTASDIQALKMRLADELEAELKTRIKPLLKQVDELAKSSQKPSPPQRNPEDEMLENQVREIVAETKKELENFKREQEIEEEAVQLYQRPSLESLLSRLDAISEEEEAIRRRWQEINYEDFKMETPMIHDGIPKTPQSFKFTKTTKVQEDVPKEIVNFIPNEDRFPCPQPAALVRTVQSEDQRKSQALTLILPDTTVYAIEKGKKEFERHLKFAFHEPKGNFNPWKLVEELSDDVLNDVVEGVCKEVNDMCEFYAEEMFKGEFADAPNLTDSSLMTSASSILDSLSCK